MELAKIADETKATLPNVLDEIPRFKAADSSLHDHSALGALHPQVGVYGTVYLLPLLTGRRYVKPANLFKSCSLLFNSIH